MVSTAYFCLVSRDSMNCEPSLDIKHEPEVLPSLVNGDHI